MIQFIKPENLNGAELRDELNANGVAISDDPFSVKLEGDGSLWLDIAEADKAKATPIVAAHNGTTVAPELTVAQKLASVGLSLEELKAALGSN
jgi:hypothetical protein